MGNVSYGYSSANTLRRFVSQTLCTQCGVTMPQSKKNKEQFICRSHPDETRDIATINSERLLFEVIRTAIEEQGIKGIIIHKINYDNMERGDFINSISSELLANPSLSLPVALAADNVLRKAGQLTSKLITVHKGGDGFFGAFWRIANVNAEAELLSTFTRAIEQIKKGMILGDYFIEPIITEDDELFATAADLLSVDADVPKEHKEKAKEVIVNYKKSTPRL